MPTYEYECAGCGNKWELFQSITADPVKKCPKCGKNKAKRLIGTGSSIIFKGSGFYTTDYRSESYKQGAKAESEAASGKKDEGKAKDSTASSTDSKPKASETASSPPPKPTKGDKKKKSA